MHYAIHIAPSGRPLGDVLPFDLQGDAVAYCRDNPGWVPVSEIAGWDRAHFVPCAASDPGTYDHARQSERSLFNGGDGNGPGSSGTSGAD